MERTNLSSSTISEVGFEANSNTLEILFRDGRVYQYFDVPENIFDALKAASSAGQFFHQNIRGVFRFARV
jgi:hypothetical protein